jgi:hypothetical protein
MPLSQRHPNAVPTTLTLDPEAKRLLRTMATSKTLGAFVCGLIRAEAARREQRQQGPQQETDHAPA